MRFGRRVYNTGFDTDFNENSPVGGKGRDTSGVKAAFV